MEIPVKLFVGATFCVTDGDDGVNITFQLVVCGDWHYLLCGLPDNLPSELCFADVFFWLFFILLLVVDLRANY